MTNSLEKTVSNWEEIRPRKAKSELPLVVFTLLGQMAAGMALFSFFSGPFSAPVLVVLGGLIGLAGLSSLLHLGAPRNAWRAIVHQKKSWLSREILIFGLFAGTWVLYLFLPGMGRLSLALTGIGLVYSMAQVYRLRAMPAWDTDHTLLTFAVSAVLLGSLVVGVVNSFTNIDFSSLPFAGLGLGGAFALSLSEREVAHHTTRRLRSGLILVALLGVLTLLILPNPVGEWIIVPIFIIVLMEEGIGRWLFYEHAQRREL